MSTLLILTWVLPLGAAAVASSARFWWVVAVAALPALAAAALVPLGHIVEIPWLLLGTVLGLDGTSRIFLAFTSILWLAAGISAAGSMRASSHSGRFRSFFLLAMAGNFWLIVGMDLASFYTGFSLMGLASYGLVVHEGDKRALRAGKVYLAMTVLGELALFVSLVLIAGHVGGLVPSRAELVGLSDLSIGLLILGLAIKAGLVPVHVWLPLAHPAAPVPASAVLSGAMIKVALLGWLRFLPIGEVPLTEWGLLLLILGLLTAFYAIPIGLIQSSPKVILAYSSVSKMGLMALTLGLILLEPDLAPAGILAISIYAAHHAIVKGGLFLGVGLRHYAGAQGLVLAGIALLALSLAGVPPSSGAVAKYGIKPMLAGIDWSWLTAAVTLSTIGTALLMARFLWVIWRIDPHPQPGQALAGWGWAGLVALSLVFALLLGNQAAWATNALPIGVALALAVPITLVAWRKPDLLRPAVDSVPAGDLLGLVRPLLATFGFASRTLDHWRSQMLRAGSARLDAAVAALGPPHSDPERILRSWPSAGAVWLITIILLLALSIWKLPEPEPLGAPPVVAADPLATLPPRVEPNAPAPATDAQPEPSELHAFAPAPGDTEVEPLPPADSLLSDAPEPVTPAVPEDVVREHAADILTPGDRRAESKSAVAAVAIEEAAKVGLREGSCDPMQPFVFGHPAVTQPLRLRDCAQDADGAMRLVAPPLTNQLVDLVQRHLNDLGYDAGLEDGLIGPRTRGAIRRFQRDKGSYPTGTIDFALLKKIQAAIAETE